MRAIIVPTDFSPVALNATNYAVALASRIKASLFLIHVCQFPLAPYDKSVPLIDFDEITRIAEIRMSQLKEEVVKISRGQTRIFTEIRTGDVVTELEMCCAGINPYAIIMGSHGAGVFERAFFGSHTLSAIRRITWPLIIVPAEAKFKTMNNIGLACDFRKVVDTAPVEVIRNLVNLFTANLHVLHINKEQVQQYDPEFIKETALFQEMLGDLHPKYHFIDHDHIDEGLNEYADKLSLDLLIIVPKKHGLVDRILHNSQTRQLVMHSHLPLMAVHE